MKLYSCLRIFTANLSPSLACFVFLMMYSALHIPCVRKFSRHFTIHWFGVIQNSDYSPTIDVPFDMTVRGLHKPHVTPLPYLPSPRNCRAFLSVAGTNVSWFVRQTPMKLQHFRGVVPPPSLPHTHYTCTLKEEMRTGSYGAHQSVTTRFSKWVCYIE